MNQGCNLPSIISTNWKDVCLSCCQKENNGTDHAAYGQAHYTNNKGTKSKVCCLPSSHFRAFCTSHRTCCLTIHSKGYPALTDEGNLFLLRPYDSLEFCQLTITSSLAGTPLLLVNDEMLVCAVLVDMPLRNEVIDLVSSSSRFPPL